MNDKSSQLPVLEFLYAKEKGGPFVEPHECLRTVQSTPAKDLTSTLCLQLVLAASVAENALLRYSINFLLPWMNSLERFGRNRLTWYTRIHVWYIIFLCLETVAEFDVGIE